MVWVSRLLFVTCLGATLTGIGLLHGSRVVGLGAVLIGFVAAPAGAGWCVVSLVQVRQAERALAEQQRKVARLFGGE